MPKNIIYCADGTWNEPEEEENGVIAPSNVYKLFLLLERNSTQLVDYEKGVGTASSFFDLITGGIFGKGIFNKIQDGYEFLAKNYEAGDKIYLFGFSRGAYTVRALAKIIEMVGLTKMEKCTLEPFTNCLKLQANNYCENCSRNRNILTDLKYTFSPDVKLASQLSKIKEKNENRDGIKLKFVPTNFENRLKEFQNNRKPRPNISIEFIGVWDTVERLRVNIMTILKLWYYKLNKKEIDINSHGNVKNFYHALAIDENRLPFLPTLANESKAEAFENIKQVWFTGAHSNVGGGYKQTSLSNNTLRWMVQQAQNHGVTFNGQLLQLFSKKPTAKKTIRDELDGVASKIIYSKSIFTNWFRPIRNIQKLTLKNSSKIRVASSVYERLIDDPSYRPKELPKKEEVIIEEDF